MKELIKTGIIAVLIGFGLAASPAEAVVLDLTGGTTEGIINGALYSRDIQTGTGTGTFPAFVQIDRTGNDSAIEQAYNTTVDNVLDNKASDQHNHEITISQIPVINVDGTDYREFSLDIGEPGGAQRFLSLDEVQIFLSITPNQSVETFTGGLIDISGTLIYRMDAGENSYVRLDASIGAGQGQKDMFLYVPNSLFTGPTSQYVYLYSRFGENDPNQGSFEEWGFRGTGGGGNGVIPEPASLALLGAGLGLLGFRSRKKTRA
ncbi:MAG: PEP-CTERM sorting domain-containing protein [Candidatus Omnitrophica bacterium]|nr:PEP-CTERM sorting domain-containing protein [Candidatus Omnitrophota bacterium]